MNENSKDLTNLLAELGQAAEQAERDADEPFPDTWNPANPDHPNPIVMAAFPQPMKPRNATEPLVEATHMDGRVFTVWISKNLAGRILAAGVQVGSPCAIKRGKKQPITLENGQPGSAWRWTVTTPQTITLPRGGRGGQALNLADLVELSTESGEEVLEGTAEPEPELPVSDDIPF
jgi:hypothetical protein